ncbi:hypothetical protein BBAD15_g7940 [Beauveria bassiana D1-5]|uniref:Fungal specific transcription n=1 Tax=Beauveria bassiana D1-5 TaxID=1245745 RepID=A0A0A2VFV5_BEABA|nr:hypothetical protein BBAD15_g7940 [Beauveria bassiana D1-5]
MPRTALIAFARHSLRHHHLLRHPASTVSHHHAFATPPRPFSMSSSRAASSSSSSPSKDGPADHPQYPQGLPAPGDAAGSDSITLDVSGEGSTVKLAALGPLVVNVDGTVARIANWKEMTAVERETTIRMVGRRNEKRLDALRKQNGEEQKGGGGGGGEQ